MRPKLQALVFGFCLLGPALGLAGPFGAPGPAKAEAYVAGRPWPWQAGKKSLEGKISANLGTALADITPWHFGQNTSWWSGKKWNLDPDRIAKLKAADIKTLRFPGGSSSDNYFWNNQYGRYAKTPDGSEDNLRMNGPRMFDTDDFIKLCKATGALPILTINYGLARYGSLKEACDLAASWLVYFREHGLRVLHVEVGNENYGDWESGSKLKDKGRLKGSDYGRDFKVIAKALRAVDKDVQVGAVVVPLDNDQDWTGFLSWSKGVLTQVRDDADFLIYHEYFLWPFDQKKNFVKPSYEKLLSNAGMIAESRQNFDAMALKYMGGKKIPIAFTEFNILNGSGPQTIENVNLLFTAAILGEAIKHGFASSYIWDWQNGLDEKLKGDHGMLAKNDPEVPNDTPRPSYYAYAAWSKAAGDEMVESSVSGPGLRAFATEFKSGEAGLVLINENEAPLTVEIKLNSFKGKGLVNAWCAEGGTLSGKTVRYNGESGPKGGGGPFPLASPYSLKAENGMLSLALPPASVTSLLAH